MMAPLAIRLASGYGYEDTLRTSVAFVQKAVAILRSQIVGVIASGSAMFLSLGWVKMREVPGSRYSHVLDCGDLLLFPNGSSRILESRRGVDPNKTDLY